MQPSITTLEKEIAREERIVGIRPGQRLTPARISRRQFQVASVVVLVSVVVVIALLTFVPALLLGPVVQGLTDQLF